jgi:hypothetical protein
MEMPRGLVAGDFSEGGHEQIKDHGHSHFVKVLPGICFQAFVRHSVQERIWLARQ